MVVYELLTLFESSVVDLVTSKLPLRVFEIRLGLSLSDKLGASEDKLDSSENKIDKLSSPILELDSVEYFLAWLPPLSSHRC